MREIRARVKGARGVVATRPGLADELARHGVKAARFYARFGITEAMYRRGVPSHEPGHEIDRLSDLLGVPVDVRTKPRSRAKAATRTTS